MFRFSEKSGVHGFSGLHGTSGVYGNSGVYKVSGFNPLDLDPYLLFDAETSMIGTLENPTLDLDPSKPDTLNVITATRAGTATFTDANGLIASASPNTVRVDQTQGAELTPTVYQYFLQTDLSNSYWTKRNSTITSGFSSPDGGNNAFKMVASQADGDVFGSGVNTGNSHTKVVSVFAKAASATSKLRIQEQNYTGKRTEFDLNLGTITYSNSSGTSTIENVGDGWYRCAHVETYSSGLNTVAFALRSVTADSLFLFGPQVEEGTTPSSFLANTTGSPKFTGISATYGPRVPMVLIEPSATNLVTYSEDFSHSSWLKNGVGTGVAPVVTLNAAESPDGTQNATKVVFDTGSGTTTNDVSTLEDLFSATNGASYTQSIYLKGETGGEKILLRHAGLSAYTTITLTTEWARYEVTETAIQTFGYYSIGLRQGLGGVVMNSSITVYAYGAQVETGSVATSLIPTSGSTATRAKDDLEITGSDFTGFFNNSEGTFYVETTIAQPEKQYAILRGGSTNQLFIYSNNDRNHLFYDGNPTTNFGLVTANQLSRFALSYKSGNITASLNGSQNTGTPSGLLASSTKLEIGTGYNPDFNGHIKRVLFWPTHSSRL